MSETFANSDFDVSLEKGIVTLRPKLRHPLGYWRKTTKIKSFVVHESNGIGMRWGRSFVGDYGIFTDIYEMTGIMDTGNGKMLRYDLVRSS